MMGSSTLRRRLTFLIIISVLIIIVAWIGYQFLQVAFIEWQRISPSYYPKAQLIDIYDSSPSHYYLDFRGAVQRIEDGFYANPPFDEKGIPVRDYHHTGWLEIPPGRYYNPVIIAQYALGCYEKYLYDRNGHFKAVFLKQANWLRDHQREDGGWPCAFPIPSRDLKPGWISAMYQGQAISVLIRAYVLTGDAAYLYSAELGLKPFYRTVDEGGVVYIEGEDIWLEEYPHDPPSHVLNGAIFALLGLYDYWRVRRDEGVYNLFSKGVATLARNLWRYEKNMWVLYQLEPPVFASADYYALHIELLRVLARISKIPEFEEYADKWDNVYELKGIPFVIKRTVRKAWGKIIGVYYE